MIRYNSSIQRSLYVYQDPGDLRVLVDECERVRHVTVAKMDDAQAYPAPTPPLHLLFIIVIVVSDDEAPCNTIIKRTESDVSVIESDTDMHSTAV